MKMIEGWVCAGCNTFWRDNNFKLTKEHTCPICNEPRSKGKELVLNDKSKEQWKYSKREY